MITVKRVKETEMEGVFADFAAHPGWQAMLPLLDKVVEDMKHMAIDSEERHLYHKGYLQGAEYLLAYLRNQLNSYKD